MNEPARRPRKPSPEVITETAFRRAVVDALNALPGVWVTVNESRHSRFGRAKGLGKGSPDIVGHVARAVRHPFNAPSEWGSARFFALEVKRPGGAGENAAHRAEQDAWATKHRAMGAFVVKVAPALTVQEGIDMALAAVDRCRRGEVA